MYEPTYTACDVCGKLLDRLHTYMGRVMCGTCLMEITMADNTMPDIPKDPEAWSDKDYEDHDELLATLRLYGANIPKDSEMSDNLVGVHLCPACSDTLAGEIGRDGVCDGCGYVAYEPE